MATIEVARAIGSGLAAKAGEDAARVRALSGYGGNAHPGFPVDLSDKSGFPRLRSGRNPTIEYANIFRISELVGFIPFLPDTFHQGIWDRNAGIPPSAAVIGVAMDSLASDNSKK